MRRFTTRLALAALAALALSSSRLAAADGYTVTDLGALPGMPFSSIWQQTLNQNGEVTAYANSSADDIANGTFFGDAGFVWKNGVITPLPGLPGAIDTIPFGLNNRGQVVGRSTVPGAPNHPVLWDHGVIQTLPELPGDNKGGALQINDRGQAVGYSANTDTGIRRAALWYKGTISQLTSLPGGGGWDEGLGINAEGQIVGFSGPSPGLEQAALWDKAGVHDLGTLGGSESEAIALNNQGQVVGVADTASGGPDAFLWQNGVMTDLGVLPGDVGSAALGINQKGQIVGISGPSGTGFGSGDIFLTHAVLWENGQMIDLQTKIPAGSGWTITEASGINDRGQIVAQGIFNGNLRAVLLTPQDEEDEGDD